MDPRPAPSVGRVPIFQQPFAGDFPLANFFDHDLPFEFVDTNGFILTSWGAKTKGTDGHDGYDWLMPEGTPLLAVADGVVSVAGSFPVGPNCPIKDAGQALRVTIQHTGTEFQSMYTHMSRIDVKQGDRVRAGEQIGLSGNTGCSFSPHLHFWALRRDPRTQRYVRDLPPENWSS